MSLLKAIRAFQLAEQGFGELMQASGTLFDPALGVEAGLLAALPHLVKTDAADSGRVSESELQQLEYDVGQGKYTAAWVFTRMKQYITGALAAQGQGEAVEIEAVGRVERDMTGDLGINWLIEGGIHGIGEGSVLLCADRNVTDDEGSATLYTSAPPASPAGVPDRSLLRAVVDEAWGEATESEQVPSTIWADRIIDRVLVAAPAATPEGGEVGL